MELKSVSSDKSDTNTNNATSNKTHSNNKAVNGRRKFGENGFEEGGGYMAVKKAKLDNQFNVSTRGVYNDDESSEIFKGISIYINGYTDPPEPVLREIFIRNGGTFHPYNSAKTTYVVATNLAAPTKQRYGSKTIIPNWIIDSVAAGRALDTRNYMLYNFNQEKKQMTLTQVVTSKKTGSTDEVAVGMGNANDHGSKEKQVCSKLPLNSCNNDNDGDDDAKEKVSESEDEFFECSQDFSSSSVCQSYTDVNSSNESANNVGSENEIIGPPVSNAPNSNGCTTPDKRNPESPSRADASSISPNTKAERLKTATDEGFLEDFFGRSRLHLISEQKKEMQLFVGNLRKTIATHEFPNLQKFESECGNHFSGNDGLSPTSDDVILMHVDLDCFFVSVGLLSRPHLRGKPVVVTHSSGKVQESKSDIACASYEARKFGVRNGMWVGEAKSLCPDLEVIPYDFEEYRRISQRFFQTVASVTLEVEPCSVDEMIIDVTSILRKVPNSTPENLAAFLRKIILAETNCPASIGIGCNRLLAKLAVKLAKPDGIYYLKGEEASTYIHSLKVRDLPGVGWSNEEKLRELNVNTCGDLLKVPLKELKAVFGEKTAEKIQNLCKGIDTAEIKVGLERPKSLSVDVNFGIRFTKEDEVSQFLMKICKELSSRADKIQAVSTHFTLKLLIRKKGAGDPLKHGGHGIVDSMTRSRTLLNPTRNWPEFYKTACSLARLMRVPPTEYRGIGVTISDLTFDCDKSNKKSVQRTLTDMPISRAQKMLSISQKKNKTSSIDPSVISKPESDFSPAISPDGNLADAECRETSNNNNNEDLPGTSNHNMTGKTCNNLINGKGKTDVTSNGKAPIKDVSKLPVDIAVLRQLPREIAEEQCQFYGIDKALLNGNIDVTEKSTKETEVACDGSSNVKSDAVDSFYDNIETVDESFLQALPENVRQDVLIQLQEAKGRRKINDANTVFDDQQPCSSKQALERIKRIALHKPTDVETSCSRKDDPGLPESLEEQTTPIISYPHSDNNGAAKIDPKLFWDMSVEYYAAPFKPSNRPALSDCVEVSDVRNLIRKGLEVVVDPTPEEVENLEKYFVQLISDGWLEQTHVLLKFLYRQTIQLGDGSKWTPALHRIIQKTQECCKRLYHGELEVE